MLTSCRCGCGRQVTTDARRRRQLLWMDVALDGSSRAQHAVAADAVSYLEDVVRRYGCTAAAEELPEWRDRADLAGRGAGRQAWTPEERSKLIASMEVDARRRQLGELETRDRAQQLERMGVSTETVDYVETTPPRTAAAVAAETALLAADHAGILPPHIRWFTRARGRVDERRVVRRGSPVRGFVDRMERPPTIWLNVGQDHDDLVEAVIHEVAHLRVGDAGRSELAVHRFVDDYNNVGPGWFDRRDR